MTTDDKELPPAKPWDACDHYPSDLTKAACSCWRGAPAKIVDQSPPWGCVHGYTMPHADTICPHCCPLAWRSGTTYSRDEHVAALEAMKFSTRMATIEECARAVESMTCFHSAERELLSDTASDVRALREVKP